LFLVPAVPFDNTVVLTAQQSLYQHRTVACRKYTCYLLTGVNVHEKLHETKAVPVMRERELRFYRYRDRPVVSADVLSSAR
jgi:hypothetical protein